MILMVRREFLGLCGGAALLADEAAADFTLRIQPITLEISRGKTFKTVAYNGTAPGPLLRMPEGKRVSVDVINETATPEIVHWHGLHIPSNVDGAMEEGTPMVPPRGRRRYTFTPRPCGTRWYHTHAMAGRDMRKASYTAQFGFLYVEPKNDPGRYDQEVFVSMKEWDPFITTGGEDEGSMDAGYRYFSMDAAGLTRGEPLRVKAGQRLLLRLLNASATVHRRIALAGHTFRVLAMDGNPVAKPREVEALELGPAERIDVLVAMNNPGIWILGTTVDKERAAGMALVFEYAGSHGNAVWVEPDSRKWDYTMFGSAEPEPPAPAERIPVVIEKKFAGHNWVDKWTINGKSFPKTDPFRVNQGMRYRLVFDNRSDEAHPLHLHRHTFELKKIAGIATAGVWKDVVVAPAKAITEVELVADNPGSTLFHCHQQMHMDYGFMCMMEYV